MASATQAQSTTETQSNLVRTEWEFRAATRLRSQEEVELEVRDSDPLAWFWQFGPTQRSLDGPTTEHGIPQDRKNMSQTDALRCRPDLATVPSMEE